LATEKPSSPQTKPGGNQGQDWRRQSAIATELPFVLVFAMLVGGGIGYLLDRWLHTKPWLTLVFGAIGFGVGIRDVLTRMSKSGNGYKPSKP
jgi:F0F1-type ATP synthase assembly protein I